MNKLDLQKVIREEVKKALNETYRDAKENVAILHAMLKKGGKEAKYVKDLFKDIKDELSVIMSTTDPKANLKLANKNTELDEYLDSAVEDALDDGMGRARGMMGSMQGMREGVKKSLKETYRDAKENVAIIYAMLKKGGKEAKYVKELFKDIKLDLAITLNPANAKETLKIANRVPELDEYLDDAVENAMDDGMARAKGMSGGMAGMREATVTKDDLDKIGDYVMSSPAFENMNPTKMKAAIKDIYSEWKAVAKNYKNIEAYFEEMEEMGGEESFMESKKPGKSKKTLKEGYAWERGERKFGEPLPTLASIQAAHQAKQNVSEYAFIPYGEGKMISLRPNREYSILDAGTDEWNEYKYLGEIGQGSSAGNPGDYMFYATDAPDVYIFVALSVEDLKTMVKPIN